MARTSRGQVCAACLLRLLWQAVQVCGRPIGPFPPRDELFWPLCGRISESPPSGWSPTDDGCPPGRRGQSFSDAPIRSTFGPRPLVSQSYRYDFHRGLDISTPIGTPMFAIADGDVRHAGSHSSYDEPVIIIRHYRPGFTSCSTGGGCFHAMYLHSRTSADGGCCAVSTGDKVVAGQLLGYSGASASGYAHLHFELRDAPADDPFSYWQRDCVHPLSVLPYQAEEVASAMRLSQAVSANVTVALSTLRRDVVGVSLSLLGPGGAHVEQPGDTPDALGYNVFPASMMFNDWNFQWTHKDSSSVPWESWEDGGSKECPFRADHDETYDAHVHMDRTLPGQPGVGSFNGVEIALNKTQFWEEDRFMMNITFHELSQGFQCSVATVHFADGTSRSQQDC